MEVALDRAHRDDQALGDLTGRQALGRERGDLALPPGQDRWLPELFQHGAPGALARRRDDDDRPGATPPVRSRVRRAVLAAVAGGALGSGLFPTPVPGAGAQTGAPEAVRGLSADGADHRLAADQRARFELCTCVVLAPIERCLTS